MVAYVTPAERRDEIASGRQTFLLAIPRKHPSRHARVGELITLRPGGQSLGAALCVARCVVHIGQHGLLRVLDDEHAAAGRGSRAASAIMARLANAEDGGPADGIDRNRLARELGYSSWPELWKDQMARETGPGDLGGRRLAREVIAWDPAAFASEAAA